MIVKRLSIVAIALALTFALGWPALAYIEVPHSFGQVVGQSTNIVLMRVEAVDKEKNLIIYRKVRDVKGVHPQEVIKHNIGRNGLRPNEWKPTMDWAEPGKIAVFFYNGGASETCIGNWWYQAYAGGEWWNHVHGEPFLLRSYCGPPEKLPALVTAVMENKEVIVPCMVDGNKEDLHNRTAKIQRLKASLKLQTFDQKRDFVGWGGEEFRRLQGMPGFTHITALPRTDPDAHSISVVDFDNDGKPDVCLVGGGKLIILQNNGDSMSEITLPGLNAVQAAVWADVNKDGLPDLLAASASGPRLYTNLGKGVLRDDSRHLPVEDGYQVTAAAWADVDGDGKPDIILANGYHGIRVYRNSGVETRKGPPQAKMSSWSTLGPFPYTQATFNEKIPADTLDLTATYDGKGGKKVAWKKAEFSDGAVNSLLEVFPPDARTWVSIYLHRTIEVTAPTELPVSFGSDDALVVRLDGKRIVTSPEHRGCMPDQHVLNLKLAPGKHDLVMKVSQGDGEFGFYFQAKPPEAALAMGLAFEDISRQVGFGPEGPLTDVKYDALVVQDVNGDGRPDLLYGNRLYLNQGAGAKFAFTEVKDSGLTFQPIKAGPIFGDFDGDGIPDLFVPQKNGSKLYKGDGAGRFADVTAKAGDLAKSSGWVTSAVWADVDNDGQLDLVLGCFKGSNRYFRNKGAGVFEDATDKLGLDQKIFNTQAVSCVDLNNDGQIDFIFNNEGQDSTILLGSGVLASTKRMPLTLRVQGKIGAVGSQVRVLDKGGKLLARQELSGGDSRGGQQPPFLRFALEPGAYQVQLRLSNGTVRSREFTIGDSPVRGIVGEDAP
jgi:hypothetical protein